MIQYLILALVGLGMGVFTAFSLPHNNPYIRDMEETTQAILGIKTAKKRTIYGFEPFWLIKQADKDYASYIDTFSYFGFFLNGDGSINKHVNPGEQEPGWGTFQRESTKTLLKDLQKDNVHLSLTVILQEDEKIEELLSSPEEHAGIMIEEVEPIMKTYGFTDLNIDIETLAQASEELRTQFTRFIKETRRLMQEKNLGTMGVDVIGKTFITPQLTDVRAIEPYIDYIFIMAYDYHYFGSYIAGPVAPAYGEGIKREYDVNATIKEVIKVVPGEKIILGIPLYGYGWDTITNVPGGPTIKGTGKVFSHRQAEEIRKTCGSACKTGMDDMYKQPYIIMRKNDGHGDYYQQIFYENKESLRIKLDMVEKYNLAGIGLWALGYEGSDMTDALRTYKAGMREE